MKEGEVFIAPDLEALYENAAELFVMVAAEAIDRHGRFAVALSGGSTPKELYRLLASQPWRGRMPWDLCHFFWGDERLVRPDHPGSNFHLAEEELLGQLPLVPNQIHRVPVEAGNPEEVALAYEEELRSFFNLDKAVQSDSRELGCRAWPRFDLILLGLGPDGHTASLFPSSRALEETERFVVPTPPGLLPPPIPRVTLTLPVLNSARVIAFLIAGADKSGVLRELLEGNNDLPAAKVKPGAGRMFWLVDRAAYPG